MKRFTETNKWSGWYRKLSPSEKILWDYIKDNCDNSGVWRIDKELAEFQIGCKIKWEEAVKSFGCEIFVLTDHWYITGFILEQAGEKLNPASPPHKKIIDLLKSHKIFDKVIDENYRVRDTLYDRVRDRDKEEEKENTKEEEKEVEEVQEEILHELQIYIKENLKNVSKLKTQLTYQESERLISRYPRDRINLKLLAMENKKNLLKEYNSVNLTLINWLENDTKETKTKSQIKNDEWTTGTEHLVREIFHPDGKQP